MTDFDDKIKAYAAAMSAELKANAEKGTWDAAEPQELLKDLLYHVAKLVLAVGAGNPVAVHEYAADVGNEALMIADVMAALELPPASSPTFLSDVIRQVNPDVSDADVSGDDPGIRGTLMDLSQTFVKDAAAAASDSRFFEVKHPPVPATGIGPGNTFINASQPTFTWHSEDRF